MTPSDATLHRVRFDIQAAGERILATFADPAPALAVAGAPGAPADIEILCVPGDPAGSSGLADDAVRWVSAGRPAGAEPPLTIALHGTQVAWYPDRAAILAPPDRLDLLLLALVEFTFFEQHLSRLEREIADVWPGVAGDLPLAYEATSADLDRREEVGQQVRRVLAVRLAHARLAPRLRPPTVHLASLANQLGERLRERTRVEDRLDHLLGQVEALERVYEPAAQRLSEFRLSRQEQTLEWVIIVLLATETILLLVDLVLTLER